MKLSQTLLNPLANHNRWITINITGVRLTLTWKNCRNCSS